MKELLANSPKYRGNLGSGAWTLCIGAGISRGIVPTWNELTRRIINEVFSTNYDLDEFYSIVSDSGWGLDGWIQASANEYTATGKTLDDFHSLIENALYGDLRENALLKDIEDQVVIALNAPRSISRENVFLVCDFIEEFYQDTSILSIAKMLISAQAHPQKLPSSIITFNADTLLHTIVELFQRRNHYQGPLPHSHPQYFLRTVMRSTGGIPVLKIPIFHCHGAIKPEKTGKTSNKVDSRDRLVFLEQEYLQLASSSSAWPETVFMYNAQANTMVFVGLSMADSNIRRWMATANKIRLDDLEVVAHTSKVTPKNLWVTTKSTDTTLNKIKQISLTHLGIRPAWINSWSELQSGMENLLGL